MPNDKRPSSPEKLLRTTTRSFSQTGMLSSNLPVRYQSRRESALRLLNNYVRATMGNDSLSYLALLHIHYDTQINVDHAVDLFAKMYPRGLQLESVLKH